MRINRYVANASGLGRRQADKLIAAGRVKVDSKLATMAQDIKDGQKVSLDGKTLELPSQTTTIALNKPRGYVVSRSGQGAPTIYSLLPEKYHMLKPIGRLDKDTSGLILLSNDGQFAQSLSHPSFNKQKIYEVSLDKVLSSLDKDLIDKGVELEDGLSLVKILSLKGNRLVVSIEEGRNRQIRRTFSTIGYKVNGLNRTNFSNYALGDLALGDYREVKS